MLQSEAESADKGKAALVKKYEVATKKVKELERQATTAKEREAHLQVLWLLGACSLVIAFR